MHIGMHNMHYVVHAYMHIVSMDGIPAWIVCIYDLHDYHKYYLNDPPLDAAETILL